MTLRRLFSGRSLPSPATCLAAAALFVSLGGTTYAVTALPSNSVGTQQLRAGAVKEKELANSSVITRKLANGAVTSRKIARESITGSRVAPNALGGPQIDEGTLPAVPLADRAARANLATRATTADSAELAQRANTAATAEALSAVDTNSDPVSLAEGSDAEFVVTCDAGLVPVGGGFLQTGDFTDVAFITSSAPSGSTWIVRVADIIGDVAAEPMPGEAYAVCVKAGQS